MLDDIKPQGTGSGDVPPLSPSEDQNQLYATIHSNRLPEADETGDIPIPEPMHPKGPGFIAKLKGFWASRSNLQRGLIIVGILILIMGASAGAYFGFFKQDPPPPPPVVMQQPEPEPEPEPILSELTGMKVSEKEAALPVTGVMIENSPDARPQTALRDAGVVFEAIAEGGITRFLALFQEAQPGTIGPVRSVRPYYLDFLVPFDAPVAHVGGSGQALAEISSQGIKDLDQFRNPSAYYRSSARYAPHNMYTSRKALLELHKAKGYKTSKFTGYTRKEEAPRATPKVSVIDLSISSFNYNPKFTYDKKSNSYLRSMAGTPHKDEKSGKQIAPKVVVVVVADHAYAGIYSTYAIRGKGTVYVFQDGGVTKGTWHKKDRKTMFSFKDSKGKVIALNPGQTWITLADNTGQVKASP